MTPDEERAAIRLRMRTRLTEIDKTTRRTAAIKAGNLCRSSKTWRDARAVLLFLSMPDEFDTAPLLEAALSEGKRVFAPAVRDRDLEFRGINSPDDTGGSGPFGIREPRDNAPMWNPLATPGPALVIVPGLAFDNNGGRIGRGGGFYDRFINRLRLDARAVGEQPPVCVGYGFEFQVTGRLPLESHDERLDGLVTGERHKLFRLA